MMKLMKYFQTNWYQIILSAIIVTAFLINENVAENKFKYDTGKPEGTEFFYKPEGDTRVWHVINIYTTEKSKDAPDYNVSEYLFTGDSVLVKNVYVEK